MHSRASERPGLERGVFNNHIEIVILKMKYDK